MKRLFYVLALLPIVLFTMSSCSSDDDENNIVLNQSDVVGTWDVNTYDSQSLSNGNVYIIIGSGDSYYVKILSEYYVGTYKIDGNTIIGTTLDPITEYFKFTSLDNGKATISYSNSGGEKHTFVATRR